MMEESPEEERKREEMLRMYHACKQALQIIGDVSMQTCYQPAPPPIKDDWSWRNMAPSPTPMSTGNMANNVRNISQPPPPSTMSTNPRPPPTANPSRGAPPPPGRPAPNVPSRGAAPIPARPGLPPPLIPS